MTHREQVSWSDANQRYLVAALARLRILMERHGTKGGGVDVEDSRIRTAAREQDSAAAGMPHPPALETLCSVFGLSPFERDVLLLCAGVELDAAFASMVAQARGNSGPAAPTFGLALAAIPEAHWSALAPGAPLRRWRLVDVGSGGSLVTSPLRVDERVLHYLTGVQSADEQLAGFVHPVLEDASTDLVPSHRTLASRITAALAGSSKPVPGIELCGAEPASKRAIALAAATEFGLHLQVMAAHVLPTAPHELGALVRLWEREAVLSGSALYLDCDGSDQADPARESVLEQFIETVNGPLFVGGRLRRPTRCRPLLHFDVAKPTAGEQRQLWAQALGSRALSLNGKVERLVSQFDLPAPAVRAASSRAIGELPRETTAARLPERLGALLWDACRVQARPRLDDLAQHIEPAATREVLVLPERQLRTLREIAIHMRQRSRVYEHWGFAGKCARGLGISALFAGPSGTGKTMASEVLANELRLDLYRIDLSQVVSKYIGETEKNLRRVFDAAEEGGAILLFDEADALFGRRSEVKDSHDRYANIEISYLLQRMESYRGLAVLTTNLKSALDDAFLRRIRFVIQFPFPDAASRAEIWRRVFPSETPTEGLDFEKLGRLNVAGGNIRNIALYAAFLAAEAEEPVRPVHVLEAARAEYAKLEKPLTDGETRGWV